MSSPGIPYFPLDCRLGLEMDLIEAEFGLTGFGVVVKLWQEIYAQQGYYIEWTDEVVLLFSRKIGEGANTVSEIVRASIKRGIFDKDLFDKYRVLTSRGIQKRYFEAVSRRKQIEVKNEYLLVNVAQFCKNVSILKENVDISTENANIFKQSKEEKSKVKKSKVKESNSDGSTVAEPPLQRHKYGLYQNVLLSDEDMAKLKEEFPDWEERIERLSEYIASSGKTYKNHLATIRVWAKKDKPKAPATKNYDGEMW